MNQKKCNRNPNIKFPIPDHYEFPPYKNAENNDTRVALCCIAKNEKLYINEWLKYHLAAGFDQIIIYNNDQNPALLRDVIGDRFKERVKIIHFPLAVRNDKWENFPQIVAYNQFLINYGHQFSHVAFFDVDEFLAFHKHDNVRSFIEEYFTEKTGLLAINRYNFGTNGHLKYKNSPVVKRFTKRESDENLALQSYGVKSINLINSIKSLKSAHKTILHEGFSYIDTRGEIALDQIYNCNPDYSVVQLNHYVTKSLEEFNKRERFKGCGLLNRQRTFMNKNKNFNQVEDLSALNFWRTRVQDHKIHGR